MSKVLEILLGAIWLTIWMTGIVIAQGTISTIAAILTGGLWSFYLIIETVLHQYHLLGF